MFGVVGMVLGIVGIVQSRRNGDRRGRNYGIAAVIISGLYLVFFIGLVGLAIFREATDPVRDDAGVLRGERSIEVTALKVGDCVTDLDAQKGSRIDAVPCSAAHSSEVVGVFQVPAGTADRLTAADEGCRKLYQTYTGTPAPEDDSEPNLYVAQVTATGYDEPDVLCFSHRDSGTSTGSVKK
ncbi:septum formation family protein [Actinoplanes couchii]|uniref:septum formation family protein n=1 Tax=Actinoplanes couchii TaxID=403638 RepID=UPI0019411E8C|nr:septum formation family protein [Actinoplanes couchii]MDR6325546.1 hypothetical protein [Actinoplanes couchii]